MSCPVPTTGNAFRQIPLIVFEIGFIYLLITRFRIGFIVITVGFGLLCLIYGIYAKHKTAKLFDFVHYDDNLNEKYIPIPSEKNSNNTEHTVYCYKIPKKSLFQSQPYSFAMPQNMGLSSMSVPFQEITFDEFLKDWKDKNKVIAPYCIDPFDLSIWCIKINENSINFKNRLISFQYDWNKICQTYTASKNISNCILYRISKNNFITLCKSMETQKIIKNMKYMSKHLTLIYDNDFDHKSSIGDNLGYLMQLSSNNAIQFISNHCPFTGLQYRFVQLRRTMNKPQIKKLENQLFMLFHHYFLFFYGTVTYKNDNNVHSNDNVLLKMNSSDIFWNDFLLISLPGTQKIFIYQNIYKSIETAYNKYRYNDSICYFLSFFSLEDIYIRYCSSYPFIYMLQESINKFNEFHSDFLYDSCNDDTVRDTRNININTRDELVLNQRDTIIDLSCQILALLIYVQYCLSLENTSSNTSSKGIIEMKQNIYMIRYDTDLCNKGVDLLWSLFVKLGWNTLTTKDIMLKQKEEIMKFLTSTQCKNFHPKIMTTNQLKTISYLLAQYEGVNYVTNIQ